MDEIALDPESLADRLARHVGAPRAGRDGEAYLAECAEEAVELVHSIVKDRQVPAVMLNRAALEAGADLYWRRQARSGVATFEAGDSIETVRVALDPARQARAVLAPWLGVPIA
ncbi:MAG: hypothetical protein Q4G34_00210 [Micrococcus sp.]|nr:hypothetical protein [Micrococcus sp.]